ncbi:MAG: triose-phosphate isomerase [Bacteroidetes bacterium]|nr:MAG: triose-phosphate isomerase [Bacteroidota bacterium]REJ99948.1 MAG: triose-phosphate isomerase [Bacteroidota bacterium]REK35872.1 MAG: triose-phosphate isomerase [Bacteroidota bacterium]REK50651.1 MAG: triose-phosphate isomerase [Bacteroidota bacterium]
MRKKIAAGNWKMNLSYAQAFALADEITAFAGKDGKAEIILAPPFIYLHEIISRVQGSTRISVSAQDCSMNKNGAYTGEVSAEMLASIGVEFVIIGHSERRSMHGESNAMIAKKLRHILENTMIPIVCVGETRDERESGIMADTVRGQISECLFHLKDHEIRSCVIAYEPVWAIGTGLNANSQQISEMHTLIRNEIGKKYSGEIANEISILYGGSVNSQNAAEIFSSDNVDGGLIGGASLKAKEFLAIVEELEKSR